MMPEMAVETPLPPEAGTREPIAKGRRRKGADGCDDVVTEDVVWDIDSIAGD